MRKLFGFIIVLFIYGCGVIPGGGRLSSDYGKVSHYALSGASQTRIKMDWGKPDKIIESKTGETWVYNNRQDGKTFKFNFDTKGKLISSQFD